MPDKKKEDKEAVIPPVGSVSPEVKEADKIASHAVTAAPGTQAEKLANYVNPKNEQLEEKLKQKLKDAHGVEKEYEFSVVSFDAQCPSCTKITPVQYPGAVKCAACGKFILSFPVGDKVILSNTFMLPKALAGAR